MPNEPLPEDIPSFWQSQPVDNTPMPLEEIRRKAQQFENRIARRNLREYAGAALGIAIFTFYIFHFPGIWVRTGSALVIAGMVCIVIQIHRSAAPSDLPVDLAFTASLEFHRRELVRQRNLLRSVLWWYIGPLVPGLLVFTAAVLPPHRAGWVFCLELLLYFGVFAGIVSLNRRAAVRLDRQISELDSPENQS